MTEGEFTSSSGEGSIATRLSDLPASAKLVYVVLEEEGPLTQTGINEASHLSPRTTRDALSKLKKADLVEERVYFPDTRQSLYQVTARSE